MQIACVHVSIVGAEARCEVYFHRVPVQVNFSISKLSSVAPVLCRFSYIFLNV